MPGPSSAAARAQPGRCEACGTAALTPGRTVIPLTVGAQRCRIEAVPTLHCTHCAKVMLEPRTALRLRAIRAALDTLDARGVDLKGRALSFAHLEESATDRR